MRLKSGRVLVPFSLQQFEQITVNKKWILNKVQGCGPGPRAAALIWRAAPKSFCFGTEAPGAQDISGFSRVCSKETTGWHMELLLSLKHQNLPSSELYFLCCISACRLPSSPCKQWLSSFWGCYITIPSELTGAGWTLARSLGGAANVWQEVGSQLVLAVISNFLCKQPGSRPAQTSLDPLQSRPGPSETCSLSSWCVLLHI